MLPPPPEQLDVEPLLTVEGTVERIVYENRTTNFLVGRLQTSPLVEAITFVGSLMAISPGETLRLRGRWIEDKRFGRQLRVESYETLVPSSVQGIEKYLGSGLIEGIGPAYAKRLVSAFGIETLRVIDEQPERLQSVQGIGKKRAQQIREAWEKQKSVQSIMVFLQGHGISSAQAARIFKRFGEGAVSVIRENPYLLAEEISGIGFQSADRIAARLGIAGDHFQRLQAGLEHLLHRAAGEGHVFLPAEELVEQTAELLKVPAEKLETPLLELTLQGKLVREREDIYLPYLHRAETGLVNVLKKLVATPLEPLEIHVENALRWAEKTRQIQLSGEQREAIAWAISSKVLIITGGPGTGKTTIINSLLGILEKKGLSFLLAAPTGRAAKRMETATGREAQTIHRLLEYSPKSSGFSRNEFNPLVTDLVVVDEASMIDVLLMYSLVRALPPFARLIIVGDVDQLPSVGPGSVLLDLISSGMLPVARLRTVFRQAAESGIVRSAHLVNEGRYPEFNQHDFFLIERQDPAQVVDTLVEVVSKRLPQSFQLDPMYDIQVLAPMRRGEAGVNHLNEVLQERMNAAGKHVPRRGLRLGDKVMQLRNNYELEVFNGDLGVISQLEEDAKELEVTFDDGRKVLYPLDEVDNLGLAYAATIHKSQGSEYPAVVIPFLPQHYMMLQRNVLYTGITRGRKIVVLIGEKKSHLDRRPQQPVHPPQHPACGKTAQRTVAECWMCERTNI